MDLASVASLGVVPYLPHLGPISGSRGVDPGSNFLIEFWARKALEDFGDRYLSGELGFESEPP